MPRSMTGFATAEALAEPYRIDWELRSVNHRYLDLSFRLPEDLRGLEPELRDRIAAAVSRGKVDCTLKVTYAGAEGERAEVDHELIARLRELQESVRAEAPEAAPLTVAELLRWPGVVKERAQDLSVLRKPALASFGEAVAALDSARQREGQRIGDLIEQRLVGIDGLVATIRPLLEEATTRYRDRLVERLDKLEIEAQPERLEQELAMIAQRLDVAEEVDRLEAHVAEIRDVLTRGEPMGRRLDFLIQELNREANTLASKAQEETLARHAVDLKVLIEQMREQVQNLE
jgi:uncharacterized protein (TIGR00255 family)